jgi:hypothetical protein
MKPLGMCPFSASQLLFHGFEKANQAGVEEIPHPQNNQQDFNSLILIAKFTTKYRYNGYRFRSRLEARWAVFFDELGVAYRYEPEGFELGGTRY